MNPVSILAVFASLGAFAGIAFAQTYTPLAPLPGTYTGTIDAPTTDITTYLSGMFKLLIALGGGVAILTAIIGGTQYVAAGINPSLKEDAKGRIQNSLIGLALVLSSYLILNTIDPKLVDIKFLLPPVSQSGSPYVFVAGGGGSSGGASGAQVPTGTQGGVATTTQSSISGPVPVVISATTSTTTLAAVAVDRTNDRAVLVHCLIDAAYDLCVKADLNNDAQINTSDLIFFGQSGTALDVSKNAIIEITVATTPTSCFFKMNTVSPLPSLPRKRLQVQVDGAPVVTDPCAGTGAVLPPNLACNGATWIKAPLLANACAMGTNSTMPFGYDWTGVSEFSKFQSWITASRSGSVVNLATLFFDTFFVVTELPDGGVGPSHYQESTLGRLTYATIAPYDLNNDGLADFSSAGADIAAFNACNGVPVSGSCAQADFNGDGVIDARDLGFVTFMQRDVLGGPFYPLGWVLNQHESMLFDPTGYTDRQIINHCLGRTTWGSCGFADLNNDRVINSADVTLFEQTAQKLDLNGDGKVNLQ